MRFSVRSHRRLRFHRVTSTRLATLTIASSLLISAGSFAQNYPIVETSHATIELREGGRLRVVIATEGQPALLFKPARGVWDWSVTSNLVIPVDNLGDEPLTLHLWVQSGGGGTSPSRALTGELAIAPKTAGNLTMWLDAPAPRAMGMTAGPSLAVAGLEPGTLPVTATKGSVDTSRVTLVRLGMSRPTAVQHLIVGPLRVEPPSDAERNAYQGIVDEFGQYRPGTWPEKAGSVEMLRARGSEEATQLAQSLAKPLKLDRFGGFADHGLFGATGFFRTERRDGRWWLVTPEGNAFFSIGMDAVWALGQTYVEGREFMFHDMPARKGMLAGHWSEQDDRRGLGAQRGRSFDHGHAFDFYGANLERKFGSDWRTRWRDETLARLKAWGFNTLGNWSDPDLWAMHRLPYTVPLSPQGEYAKISSGEDWWGLIPDPFDPRFATAADRMARKAAVQFNSDPYLIGYFVGNELNWGQGWSKDPGKRYSIAIGSLAAGPDSPAKSAFIAQLAQTYREPERLGKAWGIPLSSWDDLRRTGFALPQASLNSPAVVGDLSAFTQRFAETYFRIVAESLHRHDPHHLYLGSRFAWQTPEVVKACARWCDVVTFNLYQRSIAGNRGEWAHFHALGKPALIGEFQFGSVDRGLFWEGLVGTGSESERGPAYARYLRAIADNPDFVGAHWFDYIDEPLLGRTLDGENGHIGFVSVADLPYQELVAAARDANETILRRLQHSAARATRE